MPARRRPPGVLGPLALALVVAGCAGNDLATRPDPSPGAGTWAVVWIAAGALVVVLAALLTWPAALRGLRRGEARLATAVLALQAAALWVAGAVALGAAVRTRQLSGRDLDELPVESLIELGRIGDEDFAGILELTTVVFVGLPAVILTVAARFAADGRPAERIAASSVLGLQVGVWSALVGRALLTGASGWALWLPVAMVPLVVVAAVSCWPRAAPPAVVGIDRGMQR